MPIRINKYVAQSTGMSRRTADKAILEGRVTINSTKAAPGDSVNASDKVALDSRLITPSVKSATIILNKPVGFVCSRKGQGSKTIYELLPEEYKILKPAGRLDKDSSGLLVMTNDGVLANQLTHPRYEKIKIYEIELDKNLEPLHQQMINDRGIGLEDGLSKLNLEKINNNSKLWHVTMTEGRNRQIRRTFEALDYKVKKLHRQKFGNYEISNLQTGEYTIYS